MPLDRAEQVARDAGWQRSTVQAGGLPLRVYARDVAAAEGDELHVYLGGDGRPWLRGRFPAADPSGRRALALELMREDRGAALYLGRPCYHGLADSPGCRPGLWTAARYSPQVSGAMAAALEAQVARWRPRRVVLVGYSGGGVLALAIAERLQLPCFVVTLGANLDVAAWTDYHGYLPLTESADPAGSPGRFADIPQLHLQGQRDGVVPPETTRRYTAALPPSAVQSVPDADHRCCWREAWRTLLRRRPWTETLAAPRAERAALGASRRSGEDRPWATTGKAPRTVKTPRRTTARRPA